MTSQKDEQVLIQIQSDSQASNQNTQNTSNVDQKTQNMRSKIKQKSMLLKNSQSITQINQEDNIHEDTYIKQRKLRKSIVFSAACQGQKILSHETKLQQKTLSVTCSNQYQLELKLTKSQIYSEQDNYGNQQTFTSRELLHIAFRQPQRTFSQDLDNYVTQISQEKIQYNQDYDLDDHQPYRKYSLDQFDKGREIQFQVFGRQIFVKFQNYVVQICEANIEYLHQYFQNNMILSPMIQKQIFLQKYSAPFWGLLFGYYAQANENILKQGLKEVFKNKQKIIKNKQNSSIWIDISSLLIKKTYSKAQMLKLLLLQKLKMHKCLSKIMKKQSKQRNNQKQILEELAHLEIVLSFERALNYWIAKQKSQTQIIQKQKCKLMVSKARKQMKNWMNEHNINISI